MWKLPLRFMSGYQHWDCAGIVERGQIVDMLALTDTLWLACGLATAALLLAVAAGLNRDNTE